MISARKGAGWHHTYLYEKHDNIRNKNMTKLRRLKIITNLPHVNNIDLKIADIKFQSKAKMFEITNFTH